MKKIIFISFILMSYLISTHAQTVLPLYGSGAIPNAIPCNKVQDESISGDHILIVKNITKPTLTVYLPSEKKSNGTAVLICPGGGYSIVAAGHEGADVAKAFNAVGITAFVLRYRLPDDACMTDKMFVPLMDAQQAMYLIRSNAKQWNIDTSKVGIMGFSAGGHLASTVGTHFQNAVRAEISGFNLRPDFMMLIYPVISFSDSIGHIGSRDNLLGKNPNAQWVHYFSNDEKVTAQTPPTFLVQASDDDVVNPENSIVFYNALLKNHVPAELHLYEHGGHGFGLNNKTTNDQWFETCKNWMKENGWL